MTRPKAYSSGPIEGYEEVDDIYLPPAKQIKPINQQYYNSYSPFVKDYNRIDYSKLSTDEKLLLIFESIQESKNNTLNMLIIILILILFLISKINKK